ncbi:Disease resistance protein [Camellia lanceoleosa]|uniref:Disease resistance protein n=1 Tax=Camellia lanceoleosa TaxID=1840588 RepID=A0ACC0GKN8_9ERIC|nr:Disease resistance protein [Camellia lanceoleosa]
MLGFTKFTDQSTEIGRGSMLCARLKDVKKILIILDDVWDRLELTTLGIPLGQDHEGCKIIITTWREQVCRTMAKEWETTKIVWLDVLSEQDSWDLFRKNVGDAVDSSALNDVAKEICKECGGLPIAVVTVGKAMEGSKKHFVRAGCNLKEWLNVDSLDKYGHIIDEKSDQEPSEVLECSKLQILPFQDNLNAWSCSHEFLSRMKAPSVLDWSRHFYPHLDNPIRCPDTFNNGRVLNISS